MAIVNLLLGSALFVAGGFVLARARAARGNSVSERWRESAPYAARVATTSRLPRVAVVLLLSGGWYFCLAALEAAQVAASAVPDGAVAHSAPIHHLHEATAAVVRIPLPQMPPLR